MTTVLVMAKEPVPGRVKTRLCPPCTPVEAASIATAALSATLRAVIAVPGARVVLALDGRPGPWLPRGVRTIPQSDGDLATRLTHACGAQRGPTLVLGMDTPQITAEEIRAVFDVLRRPGTGAVLGPTADGGWWTLAVHDPTLPLFTGVPMSTDRTGELQQRRLERLGLRVHRTTTEIDVDEFPDALAVARQMPGSPFARAVHAAGALPTEAPV